MKQQKTLQFLAQISGRMKLSIFLLLLVQTALGISGILYALLLRGIINGAVAGQRSAFFTNVTWFVLLVCGQLVLRTVQRFLEEYTRSSLENAFKQRLFANLLGADYGAVMAVHSGEWMNRLTGDTVVVANGMTEILPGLAGMAVRLLGAVVVLLALEPRFAYLIFPAGLLMLVCSTAFRKKMKRLHRLIRERDGTLRAFLQDSLSSMLVVRSYAVEAAMETDAASRMDAHKQARMKRNHFSNFCNFWFGGIMNGAYVLGAFFCGWGILTQQMSYGTFTAVLQLIGQIQSPFANISGYLPRYYAMLASAERLMEAEQLPDGDTASAKSLSQVQRLYAMEFQGLGLTNAAFTYLPPVQGFSELPSKERQPVIMSGFNLEIRKGDYVAFTGASGCGKSTVLKLLMSLYQLDAGKRYLLLGDKQILLDGSWQKLFAYVPQGNHLMSGTIREIVAFADRTLMDDDGRIRQALTIACADEFVDELEQGVDTLLGERGLGLSEGQLQRLAIARAIFSGHPILMLDECTSALDEQTERKLLTNLRNMTDKTVLIVTHRPAALAICDMVVTFHEGGCSVQ